MSSPYFGNVQFISPLPPGGMEAMASIGQNFGREIGAGLASAGQSLGEGIKQYYKNKEETAAARAGFEKAIALASQNQQAFNNVNPEQLKTFNKLIAGKGSKADFELATGQIVGQLTGYENKLGQERAAMSNELLKSQIQNYRREMGQSEAVSSGLLASNIGPQQEATTVKTQVPNSEAMNPANILRYANQSQLEQAQMTNPDVVNRYYDVSGGAKAGTSPARFSPESYSAGVATENKNATINAAKQNIDYLKNQVSGIENTLSNPVDTSTSYYGEGDVPRFPATAMSQFSQMQLAKKREDILSQIDAQNKIIQTQSEQAAPLTPEEKTQLKFEAKKTLFPDTMTVEEQKMTEVAPTPKMKYNSGFNAMVDYAKNNNVPITAEMITKLGDATGYNGDTNIEVVNKAGISAVLVNGDVKHVFQDKVPDGAKPLSESEGKALVYGKAMIDANRDLNDAMKSIDPTSITVQGWTPERLRSDARKNYESAKTSFLNAVLRDESGGAITQEEYDLNEPIYFPKAGDGPDTIAEKSRRRQERMQAVLAKVGPSGPLYLQQLGGQSFSTGQSNVKKTESGRSYVVERQ